MNNPVRIRQIRRALLNALAMGGGYAIPEELLWGYVDDLVRPPLSFAEKGVTTAFLKDNGYIVKVDSEIDPGIKQWAVTEKGKTLLASMQ